MLMVDQARRLAAGWCDAWNRRDLDAIMAHYAEDVAFRSPGVVEHGGAADGWLRGRTRLRDNLGQALGMAGLRMTLVDVLLGVQCACVLYRRETGAMVADLMEFDADGLIHRTVSCHGAAPVETARVARPVLVQAPSGARPDIREFSTESEMPHRRDAVWAALTRPALIARWLLPNDFAPVVGHRFSLRAPPADGWDGVINAEVLEIVPRSRLSYRWLASGEPATRDGIFMGTTVTWTLADEAYGTQLRLAYAGHHSADNDAAFRAMTSDWQTMLATIGLIARDLER